MEVSTAISASQVLQDKNYADYCDALNAERWLRLLDARRREKQLRALAAAPQPFPGADEKAGTRRG